MRFNISDFISFANKIKVLSSTNDTIRGTFSEILSEIFLEKKKKLFKIFFGILKTDKNVHSSGFVHHCTKQQLSR